MAVWADYLVLRLLPLNSHGVQSGWNRVSSLDRRLLATRNRLGMGLSVAPFVVFAVAIRSTRLGRCVDSGLAHEQRAQTALAFGAHVAFQPSGEPVA